MSSARASVANAPVVERVTFLFTDIEGSTRLWEQAPEAMRRALAAHDALLDQLITERGGTVFKTVGDAFCAAFDSAGAAVATAVAGQRALASLTVGDAGPLRVRMALHMGEPELRDDDYFGPPVNRVARLLSAGHGGQILLSESVQAAITPELPDDLSLLDLGVHELRDVPDPIHIWQLDVAGLPTGFAPLKTLDYDPTNVPAPLTSFIGRDELLSEIAAMLREPAVRLVTLTGPGGIGKTRLASQLAAQTRDDFPNGRYLVELAPVTDPALMLDTIATALGVPEEPDQTKETTLHAWLRPRRLLLILDNFEQILGAAPLVTAILRAAPQVRVVVTSREALRVYGEHEVEVPMLALPDERRALSPDDLVAYEAIALFVNRAQAVRRSFTLTAINAPAIAEICQRLDGLPLAIELAAARSRLFSPQQMLERLSDRLAFLGQGSRDLPERQRSLRAAIQWSYDLLRPDAQRFFRALSVFSGGMTLDAITAVAAGDEPDDDLYDAVQSLVDQSLVREIGGSDGEPRFAMLETLREFAREQLRETGEEEEAQRRHAAYFVALASEAEVQLGGSDQQRWADMLETEHDNIRAALTYAFATGGFDAVARICLGIQRFWSLRSHVAEGRAWLTRALAARAELEPETVAALHYAAGSLAEDNNDLATAELEYQAAADQAETIGNLGLAARGLTGVGNVAHDRGNYARAREMQTRAIELARASGERSREAAALGNLGNIAFAEGDYATAAARWHDCLRIMREFGDVRSVGSLLSNLGSAAVSQCKLEEGAALHREAIELQRSLGDKRSLIFSLINLAQVQYLQQDPQASLDSLKEAVALAEEIGDPRLAGVARWNSAPCHALLGDLPAAGAALGDGIPLVFRSGDQRQMAGALEGVAEIVAAEVDSAAATRLYGAAQALRAEIGAPLSGFEETSGFERGASAAKATLGADRFAQEWAIGEHLSVEDAMTLALRLCAQLRGQLDTAPARSSAKETSAAAGYHL